ncbi:XdhC family protein [Sphingomonas sp. 10B4]|uniref:XdhC family protein n=1 Tax=Sphingomonas sp. 10B4 TaxID=3048575 RepID=UPI002AB595B2|nr:XdhC family protein [Sphingomonas sp. 10B4]MDY7525339.1 XdhC family protein [Sphingomonas sp. 10B4]MEB0283121.1 XdhC family protein [Sphingomonas sp. 10B4]
MADNETALAAFAAWRGAPMAIATVISTWGSAPRPRGSHMLVHADGRLEGSVSGGCVEGDVLALAAEVIARGTPERRQYGVADGSAWEVGLPCGGTIEVLVQPVSDAGFPPALFDAIEHAQGSGRGVTVYTDLATGRSSLSPMPGDGIFANTYAAPRQVLIVGAVQIAQALAQIAETLGVKATVIDPRTRFLTEERFPGVTLDDRWPDEAVAAYNPGPSTAVITLSHDPKIDDPALIAALSAETGYIAALGSRRSHAARLERLAAAGFGQDDLDRIDGPAGIDINAIGASEIALSVAAGMVKALHARG